MIWPKQYQDVKIKLFLLEIVVILARKISYPSFNFQSNMLSQRHKGGHTHSKRAKNLSNKHYNLTKEDISTELNDFFYNIYCLIK